MKTLMFALAAVTILALGAEARADVYFCGQGNLTVQSSSENEVGMVVSEATGLDASGTIVAKMNNYYQNGAGDYWTSALGSKDLEGGTSCWLLAGSAKQSKPSGKSAWQCSYPTITSISPNGFSVSYTDPRSYEVVEFATFRGSSFDPTTLKSEHGGPNCPPQGQN